MSTSTVPILPELKRRQKVEATGSSRLLFVDNLRWVMIVLVISMHAADTYSPFGSWYYTDRRPLSPATVVVFGAWQMYLQSFFMGLLFFVAGYFVPASLRRKGPRRFLRERAFRLGLPVLFYMFVLGPITEYFFSHSWNSTEPTSFANEWIKHLRNWQFLQENGPLWFCLALLIFSFAYALPRQLRSSPDLAAIDDRPPSVSMLMIVVIALAGFTFVTRLVLPSGFSVLNMHLGDFPQYILLFSAGVAAANTQALQTLNFTAGVLTLCATVTVGLMAWYGMLRFGGAFAGNGSAFYGGWHWQTAAFAVWEASSCVATSYALLAIFREKFNSQGRLARFLSENAFSVYVFHPPIVILGARMLQASQWPALIKFVALTAFSTIVSFALSAMVWRRIPWLRRIV